MTINRWTDEQLDKLALLAQSNTAAIVELRKTAEILVQLAEVHTTQINGLRTEVNRLIEELRSR